MARLLILFFAFLLFQQAISEIQDNGSVLIACILFLISAFIGLYLLITILGIKDKIKRIGLLEGIKAYFRSIHRLSLSLAKRQAIVWADLKNIFTTLGWKHGVYEDDKYIQLTFEIGENDTAHFFYQITDEEIEVQAHLLKDFPSELTTEIFVLATHFNNLLRRGTVTINTSYNHVEYTVKQDILKSYLYPEEIETCLIKHHRTADNVIYPAFHRLIYENEAPAIIIADLLKGMEDKSE